MSDIFIIEGHGLVRNAKNIEVNLINKMRQSGDVSFYNVGRPAEKITADVASESIINLVIGKEIPSDFYHEGTFSKNRDRDYITTSIQDKYLARLTSEEWSIESFIKNRFDLILIKNDIEFYKNKTKRNIYYIKLITDSPEVAFFSEILRIIYLNKAFKGNSRKFVWASCRGN
ncbi:hypothetical protein [uncultured Kordia sp.]|uniref:hypothetical protein n=1 Tax=uncultured Kordia sp. TaxID=507699 RepID=UPI0026064EA2|nr:hypothetical protein [uncultured Kordia sp.]